MREIELFRIFGSVFLKDEASKPLDDIEKKGERTQGKLSKAFTGIAKGAAVIGAGAVVVGGLVAAIATPLVNAAAKAKAMNAQFEQVFGDMQTGAQKTIDGLGKDFGMLPNRIKPAFSQMTSMFKGLGMDTETAMEVAGDAVTMTADAAAFYDKSFEDANGALNSFIKGNYEGGESIGLFGSATSMAAYASEELGKDWESLDEAGKQLVRLDFAEAMQESAGATGQAARESDSLENQLGNLKQAWEDIKAKFGAPILEPAVNGLKLLAEKVQGFDTQPIVDGIDKALAIMTSFGGYIKENVIPTLNDLWEWIKPNIPAIKEAFATSFDAIEIVFGKVKDAIKLMVDNLNILLPVIAGVTAAVVIQMIINSLVTAYKAWQTVTKTQTTFQWLLNAALNANPLGIVALAIGAIIAIGILLYKNWDTIKVKVIELWKVMTDKFNDIKNAVVTKVTEMKTAFTTKFGEIKSAAVTKFNEVKDAILKPINSAKDKIKGAVDTIKGYFTGMKLNLPKIKVPKFSLKNWSINPLDWIKNMPSIGINWNAKGGIFNKPTVFNTSQGLQGVGEAGAEAIIPLKDDVLAKIGKGIASTMQGGQGTPIIIQQMSVRNDNDIKQIAKELGDYINLTSRRRGYA